MLIIGTQVVYLILSVGMTVYVARSLHKNGRVFLIQTFDNDEEMADSVNHLLVVGFYLLNIGWILLWTKYGDKPRVLEASLEFITTKVGVVLLILGFVHFANLTFFWKIRKSLVTVNPPSLPSAHR